jgi:tRNA A-37 threonylcarbamoyl transferase component Bud32
MGRFLWYKDSGPILSFSRQQQIEHRAFALLLAERAGVRVPHVLTAATIGSRGDATLVMRANAGTSLDELPSDQITDSFLDDAWTQLAKLHEAGITHGSISGNSFQLTNEGAAIRDLATANTTPDADAFCIDRVALLTSVAEAADQQRAIASAKRSLGNEGLAALLPYLQTTALSRVNRKSASGLKKTCSELRTVLRPTSKLPNSSNCDVSLLVRSSSLVSRYLACIC